MPSSLQVPVAIVMVLALAHVVVEPTVMLALFSDADVQAKVSVDAVPAVSLGGIWAQMIPSNATVRVEVSETWAQ
jgi:hypothetical protein